MISLIQSRKYPLRFLLYLEWVLLGIIAISEILSFLFGFGTQLPRVPLLNLLCLLIFGIIGLRLPSQNRLNKIIYTSLEFCLVLLASIQGGILLIPLLYIIIISRNCLIFNDITCSIVNGITVILNLITQLQRITLFQIIRPLTFNEQLAVLIIVSVLTLGIGTIFIQMGVNAIIQEFQSGRKLSITNEQLAAANAQLREYALRIEELATVQERNRIARDIHDSVGHTLTVLNLHLEAALKLWQPDPSEAIEFLVEAKRIGSNALKEVRQSITALQTDPLEGLSFQEAITSLITEFQRSSGIQPTLEIDIKCSSKNELKIAVYRILQESLTNICKHSNATEVMIQIQAINNFQLFVSDNGQGFQLNQNTSGFGLQNMRDRALAVGGYLEFKTAPGAGCRIIACFPLDEKD